MNEKVFLDTNIVLDFVFERNPFFEDAIALFQLRQNDELKIYISALTLATLAYTAQKAKKDPRPVIKTLLEWVELIPLDKDIYFKTLPSAFRDFEDGIQFFSATAVNSDAIITRNKKDFLPSTIPVFTPSEYLLSLK